VAAAGRPRRPGRPPQEAAIRETCEETGLRPDIVADAGPDDTETAASLPRPAAFLLEDIDVHPDGRVAHQHVDFVSFAAVDGREVEPMGRDEADADAWSWFTPAELDARAAELATEVRDLGSCAIETVGWHRGSLCGLVRPVERTRQLAHDGLEGVRRRGQADDLPVGQHERQRLALGLELVSPTPATSLIGLEGASYRAVDVRGSKCATIPGWKGMDT
jgi:8-oxo-dGTP pyrophosphatase MutT (NUDIX family)